MVEEVVDDRYLLTEMTPELRTLYVIVYTILPSYRLAKVHTQWHSSVVFESSDVVLNEGQLGISIVRGEAHLIEFHERNESGKDGMLWIQESNSRTGSSSDLIRCIKACRN